MRPYLGVRATDARMRGASRDHRRCAHSRGAEYASVARLLRRVTAGHPDVTKSTLAPPEANGTRNHTPATSFSQATRNFRYSDERPGRIEPNKKPRSAARRLIESFGRSALTSVKPPRLAALAD
jgi:hypothetical protein